ncbi:hypothetical protein [Bradyrhizobium sp. AUGA SZCCT0182]|uniref:hypothetical protein n=1 Tax=Bradyrhizobium sp. AUGA SZCCT0182 TaxID=2807667 RepID=UPI001BABCCDC|nr:hypothetical protein [Bradyrhizobium sp. AUGA SZCCT0182]MBR1237724.1 hypothetical protein [Bradyrhizobium sp. AUGA SZCCT0182]
MRNPFRRSNPRGSNRLAVPAMFYRILIAGLAAAFSDWHSFSIISHNLRRLGRHPRLKGTHLQGLEAPPAFCIPNKNYTGL